MAISVLNSTTPLGATAPSTCPPPPATSAACPEAPADSVCLSAGSSSPSCPSPSSMSSPSCPTPSSPSCPPPASPAPAARFANLRRIGRGIAFGVATGLVGCVPALGLLVHIKAAEAATDLRVQSSAAASVIGAITSGLGLVSMCGGDPTVSASLLGISGVLGFVSGYCFAARE